MQNYCITIAREYGSGGRLIGKQLAKELGISFYDKELIALTAQESGLTEDYIQKTEQIKTSSFLYNLYANSQALPIPEQVFLAQSELIKKLAEKESCVIIGRCADYVLKDKKSCIRIFIHAPLDMRIRTVKEEYGENEKNLEQYIRKQDKGRASYYHFFTQEQWGKAQNYNLCLDSSIGIPASVRLLKKLILEFTGGHA